MFALFFSLYNAMFLGSWQLYSLGDIRNLISDSLNAIGTLLTSLFNNVETPMTTLGTILTDTHFAQGVPNYIALVCFILALITSIGIVVMAVKGIKRVFSIFFMGVR